jgi:hypothetical protein
VIIRTVQRDISPANFGPCDAHEHLFLDTPAQPGEEFLDHDKAVEEARTLVAAGGRSLVDWTPLGLGRDLDGLAHVAREDLPRAREGSRDPPRRAVPPRHLLRRDRLAGTATAGPRRGRLVAVRRGAVLGRLRPRAVGRARGPELRADAGADRARVRARAQHAETVARLATPPSGRARDVVRRRTTGRSRQAPPPAGGRAGAPRQSRARTRRRAAPTRTCR